MVRDFSTQGRLSLDLLRDDHKKLLSNAFICVNSSYEKVYIGIRKVVLFDVGATKGVILISNWRWLYDRKKILLYAGIVCLGIAFFFGEAILTALIYGGAIIIAGLAVGGGLYYGLKRR